MTDDRLAMAREAQVMQALTLDLLEWLTVRPRRYEEAMEAWRTSCPRMPVWENATDGGLVRRLPSDGGGTVIAVSDIGRTLLARHGRLPAG